MHTLLSVLLPFLSSLRSVNDAGGPGIILFGLGALLVIIVVLILLVVIVVQILKYFRNKNIKDDNNTKE